MFNMVDRYMSTITKDKVNDFAKKKNVYLSDKELDFTYNFVKKNYKEMLLNNNLFDINRYKDKYSPENFIKIKKVYTEYFSKYHKFL